MALRGKHGSVLSEAGLTPSILAHHFFGGGKGARAGRVRTLQGHQCRNHNSAPLQLSGGDMGVIVIFALGSHSCILDERRPLQGGNFDLVTPRYILHIHGKIMSTVKHPKEKKELSLERDRRNTYGENSKSSRKGIRRGKQRRHIG
jgi:hypothetical protein